MGCKTVKKCPSEPEIVFCTWSNLASGNYGDTNNNRKLYKAINSKYRKIPLFPKRDLNNKLSLNSIKQFIFRFLKEIVNSNKIFITRGLKLAFIPILLKSLFKNRVIAYLGCTPINFIERQAFESNKNFEVNISPSLKIFYFFEPFIEKYVLRHADRFIVENEKAKNLIIFFGASKNRIEIIPYYIQDYFQEYKDLEYIKDKDPFKIGYTGRFRNYDVTIPSIHAISQLKKQGYKVKLYLIGDGPNRKKVEDLVFKKDLAENILFLGAKPHNEVAELINEYHCLLFPMLEKICPSTIATKILEGVIKGKIIITSLSGNNPSLFLGLNDLILKNLKTVEIANKIKRVIENFDKYKEAAKELSEYHKKKRSKFNYEKRVNNLLIKLV